MPERQTAETPKYYYTSIIETPAVNARYVSQLAHLLDGGAITSCVPPASEFHNQSRPDRQAGLSSSIVEIRAPSNKEATFRMQALAIALGGRLLAEAVPISERSTEEFALPADVPIEDVRVAVSADYEADVQLQALILHSN